MENILYTNTLPGEKHSLLNKIFSYKCQLVLNISANHKGGKVFAMTIQLVLNCTSNDRVVTASQALP